MTLIDPFMIVNDIIFHRKCESAVIPGYSIPGINFMNLRILVQIKCLVMWKITSIACKSALVFKKFNFKTTLTTKKNQLNNFKIEHFWKKTLVFQLINNVGKNIEIDVHKRDGVGVIQYQMKMRAPQSQHIAIEHIRDSAQDQSATYRISLLT
ncbi:hypothetical protein JTB14_036282 [Gonioctena quinquepunctata]|nr:hypothetical protein JTB14_036282 [Gonioctena quinquepunctata]